ncbi:hypothetical protein [Spiroplasma endosymbiont of Polydrusus pterygomalis]
MHLTLQFGILLIAAFKLSITSLLLLNFDHFTSIISLVYPSIIVDW